MSSSHRLAYRPEIDGLRAVAVLAVLLFHAGFGCSGGYVGVDVFFVISGFLITSLIWKDLESGRFTIVEFWERRARRIVPALVVVTLATLFAGWFLLMPEDFEELGKASTAQALLMANVHCWQHTGYFAGASETKPLLHTWSLAVEEQFYLVVPVLLWGIFRIAVGRRRAFAVGVLAGGLLLSLATSVYGVLHYPSATFYLLPTRAWELLLGSLLALIPAGRWIEHRRIFRELAAMAGLAVIAWAVWNYDSATRFPAAAALPPCVGAAVFIWSCRPNTHGRLPLAGRLLATRPLVFVGMISYSLYLWHWPLLALARYRWAAPLPPGYRACLAAVAVVIAVASWQFVERPFRQRRCGTTQRGMFTWAACGISTVLLVGLLCTGMDGFPQRLPRQARIYANARSDMAFVHEVSLEDAQAGKLPTIGAADRAFRPRVLVWGDSHAMAVMPAVDALLKERGIAGRAATHSSTPPVLDWFMMTRYGLGEASVAFNNSVFSYIRRHRIPHVILSARWRAYVARGGRQAESFQQSLLRTVRRLVATGAQPWVLLDVPNHNFNVPVTLARSAVLPTNIPQLCARPHAESAWDAMDPEMIRRICEEGGRIVDPKPQFLDPSGQYYIVQSRGVALYRDQHHLAAKGARMMLLPLLRQALTLGDVPRLQQAANSQATLR